MQIFVIDDSEADGEGGHDMMTTESVHDNDDIGQRRPRRHDDSNENQLH